jgi:hypothetical protein
MFASGNLVTEKIEQRRRKQKRKRTGNGRKRVKKP